MGCQKYQEGERETPPAPFSWTDKPEWTSDDCSFQWSGVKSALRARSWPERVSLRRRETPPVDHSPSLPLNARRSGWPSLACQEKKVSPSVFIGPGEARPNPGNCVGPSCRARAESRSKSGLLGPAGKLTARAWRAFFPRQRWTAKTEEE